MAHCHADRAWGLGGRGIGQDPYNDPLSDPLPSAPQRLGAGIEGSSKAPPTTPCGLGGTLNRPEGTCNTCPEGLTHAFGPEFCHVGPSNFVSGSIDSNDLSYF